MMILCVPNLEDKSASVREDFSSSLHTKDCENEKDSKRLHLPDVIA